jgi:hypothetical protein
MVCSQKAHHTYIWISQRRGTWGNWAEIVLFTEKMAKSFPGMKKEDRSQLVAKDKEEGDMENSDMEV